ncbi:ribosome maturation factor RimM [Gephyromycinifex aptenodytis]|uniref:ribosome maturation factor RimM n=1 Tax=Gephyromycinifex aptenodytis TaxID=2716227 RepID=UPI001447AA5B|nr:ribosome maturation factor RimM [Gephyromycinifex aptenodytis]
MEAVVARIGKPHGLRGEVTVRTHTDAPQERFVVGAQFSTDPDRGLLTLRSAREHNGTWLLSFEQTPDRTAAEDLRGTELLVDEEPEDDEGAWYEDELVGLAVVDPDGHPVGQVAALHTRPVQDLLELLLPDGRRPLVPFVEAIVPQVDIEAGRIVLDAPDGLLDLG